MDTGAAGGQRLMRGGAALRVSAGLGLAAALALLTAGCFIAEPGHAQARLTHAEIMEYDGEVLTVRADLVNDHRHEEVFVSIDQVCVEATHSEPCFKAESARIISGSYGFSWRTRIEHSMPDEEGHFTRHIGWACRVQDAVLEGCSGRYSASQQYDPPGFKRLPEPLERQDVDFDFAELERSYGVEVMPGDAVQVLFRFRIPGLTPGEAVAFYYGSNQTSELVVG